MIVVSGIVAVAKANQSEKEREAEIPNTKIQIPRKSQAPRGGNFIAETQREQRNAEVLPGRGQRQNHGKNCKFEI
jgi:hypothetical protein